MTKEEIHQMDKANCECCLLAAIMKTCHDKKNPCKFAYTLQEKVNTVSTQEKEETK